MIAFLRVLMIGTALLLACGVAPAASDQAAHEKSQRPRTLVDAWLAYPGLSRVVWPYAYIRSTGLDAEARAQQKELLDELESLLWRLDRGGYTELSTVVQQWRDRVVGIDTFRLPGEWGAGWLMAHPAQQPPIARIAALGSCDMPPWVEVWDRRGVHRYDWETVSTLSELIGNDAVHAGRPGRAAIVSPTGEIAHHGIRGWNFTAAGLSPGTRVVATLPLKGEAFPWIRDAIARLLARTPSGLNCREMRVPAEGTPG